MIHEGYQNIGFAVVLGHFTLSAFWSPKFDLLTRNGCSTMALLCALALAAWKNCASAAVQASMANGAELGTISGCGELIQTSAG